MSDTEVQETENTSEETVETSAVQGNTNDSINATLDEIEDPDVLRKMIAKLRKENAKSRTEKNATKEELDQFRQWKESQMTELEKAQARAKELEEELSSARLEKLLVEFGLDEDDAEFITGTPEEMRTKAQKLAAKRAPKEEESNPRTNLHAGVRGTPVKPEKNTSLSGWLASQS